MSLRQHGFLTFSPVPGVGSNAYVVGECGEGGIGGVANCGVGNSSEVKHGLKTFAHPDIPTIDRLVQIGSCSICEKA